MILSKRQEWFDSLPRRVSSAAVILENELGQTLLVKANYKSYWTFPGGLIDAHETPREAAIREVYEEIGITLDISKVMFVAVVNRKSDVAETYQFLFKAPLDMEVINDIVLQASEIDEYRLVTKQAVATKDIPYAAAVESWAENKSGYIEERFEIG